MHKMLTDRRLFIAVCALVLMYFKPECASFACAVALGIAGSNSAQAIMTKVKPDA